MAIKEQSQRQLRIGQEIKKIVAGEINQGRIHNLEKMQSLVTIMESQVSSDLKYADVYFICDKRTDEKEALRSLQQAAGFFRKMVAQKTALRYVPQIRFIIDNSFAQVDKIEKLLADPKVAKDLSHNETTYQ